jgi:hypothetical protein
MRADLFFELPMPPHLQRTESQALADWLDEITLADQLGFGCAWLAEHHFMRGYSHCSKPEILLAAATQRTQRLRLGLAVTPVPYHHPLHFAERVAMLDIISQGRLEVGLGRGFSPREYQAFGVNMEHSRSLTQDALEILRLSFARRPINYNTGERGHSAACRAATASTFMERRSESGNLRLECARNLRCTRRAIQTMVHDSRRYSALSSCVEARHATAHWYDARHTVFARRQARQAIGQACV